MRSRDLEVPQWDETSVFMTGLMNLAERVTNHSADSSTQPCVVFPLLIRDTQVFLLINAQALSLIWVSSCLSLLGDRT